MLKKISELFLIYSIIFLFGCSSKFKYNDDYESDIEFNDKVNVYFFYSETCEHCKELMKFLNSLDKDIKKNINLYTFDNLEKQNKELKEKFLNELNATSNGTPFLVIGKKSFSGYDSKKDTEIINALKNQINKEPKDRYDVYKKIS